MQKHRFNPLPVRVRVEHVFAGIEQMGGKKNTHNWVSESNFTAQATNSALQLKAAL
jgi:hypothetical protein